MFGPRDGWCCSCGMSVEAPAEDLGGVDADGRPERLTVRAGRLVQSLGRAAHHDATRPPRRQHVVDRQRNLGISLDVAELLGPGEVATADVDGPQGRVVGPAQRHDMRYTVGIDGGKPTEPWLAEIRQLGWGEGAHHVVPLWGGLSSWWPAGLGASAGSWRRPVPGPGGGRAAREPGLARWSKDASAMTSASTRRTGSRASRLAW